MLSFDVNNCALPSALVRSRTVQCVYDVCRFTIVFD